MSVSKKYEVIIGLEIHAQISTKTKMFCRCSNDSFGKRPNINVCPICMGHPGQLPVLNKSAVEKGIVAALALNCSISEFSKFDRKQYFYPDLPKGFQISQYDKPISEHGFVEIQLDESADAPVKRVRIARLHLEDDAGKLTHVGSSSRFAYAGTLCDYNRSGCPLMEIVTEPDLRSAQEAVIFAKEVQSILRFVGSSNADMEKGMMRFDASVSLRPVGDSKLYPRAEIKNLNSFKSLESAIEYEIARQEKLWEEGSAQNSDVTVGWSDEKQETYFMRDKEGADDYRYFPEPDLPPFSFKDELVEQFKAQIPELPAAKRRRYVENWGLNFDDARILALDLVMARFFEEVVGVCADAKKAASFINTLLLKHLNEEHLTVDECKISAQSLGDLIGFINTGAISNNQAKNDVFPEMYESGKTPQEVIEAKGLKQISDEGFLIAACEKVIAANSQVVADIRGGKDKAMGALVGQVMKETQGKANPARVNEILRGMI
jgi:aspartyl-tRNA(Asn)/glutamyl-tRNA(Gln) amidotransferase subunit B